MTLTNKERAIQLTTKGYGRTIEVAQPELPKARKGCSTRPVNFVRVKSTSTLVCNSVYGIVEAKGVKVIDNTYGGTSASDRDINHHSVFARIKRGNERTDATTYVKGEWHTTTKGVSDHANAYNERTFKTFEEAEKHIFRWATGRFRVAGGSFESTQNR